MRQAIVKQGQGRKSSSRSIPAPIGGWNARDSLAAMDVKDAVIMDNFFPLTTSVMVRKGYTDWSTGIETAAVSDDVETIAIYNSATGTNKMFASAGGKTYDVSAGGAVGAAAVSGMNSNRWQVTNMATTGGKYMYMVNGNDKPLLYDGAAWVSVDAASTPAITGVTTTKLVHVNVFQRRLWFTEIDSFNIWYLAVDTVGGAATKFDLSAIFGRGGYLMAMGTWTIDAGYGMDDHAVFISSQGEIAVYKGYDPASISTWALVGVYWVGSPIGRRCFVKMGSELLIICQDGLMPLSKALTTVRVNNKLAITDKIQQATSSAISLYGGNFGWELQPFPKENMLILNVPISTATNHQYVMNTITGSWCRFTGWDAICWEQFNDDIYFGTTGKVCKAWNGQLDGVSNILAECLQAFSAFGYPARQKHFKLTRPIIAVDGADANAFGLSIGINVEYSQTPPAGWPTFATGSYSLWDSAIWDSSMWVGGYSPAKQDWLTCPAVGYNAALHMKVANRITDLNWINTDFIFEVGYGL